MSFDGDRLELPWLFEFGRTDNGCELKRYLKKDDPGITELDIPRKFRSAAVRSISANAFKDAVYLRSVSVPETVAVIGRGAFRGCRALSEITLPSGLKTVDGNMFSGC
ncbi:MAG: leucine-rich repeat domain-containing protein, partial [Ruminococcus sp.]|nr:leucine-rich repeat domain-containing protein [Ruminococcus sp.]